MGKIKGVQIKMTKKKQTNKRDDQDVESIYPYRGRGTTIYEKLKTYIQQIK
jgi:hypothetical protein